jgi:hypothetical protein
MSGLRAKYIPLCTIFSVSDFDQLSRSFGDGSGPLHDSQDGVGIPTALATENTEALVLEICENDFSKVGEIHSEIIVN